MTQNYLTVGSGNAGALGNVEYLFIAIAPSPLWPGVVAPDRIQSMGQIELFDIQTVCKQMTYAKLNVLKRELFVNFTVYKKND